MGAVGAMVPAYFSMTAFFFMGLGPKFLDNGSQPSLNGLPQNLHTSFLWGQALKHNNNNDRFTALCPGLPGESVREETLTHPPS